MSQYLFQTLFSGKKRTRNESNLNTNNEPQNKKLKMGSSHDMISLNEYNILKEKLLEYETKYDDIKFKYDNEINKNDIIMKENERLNTENDALQDKLNEFNHENQSSTENGNNISDDIKTPENNEIMSHSDAEYNENNERLWAIKSIIKENKKEYLIQWEPTWENKTRINDCKDAQQAIMKFKKKQKRKKKTKK